MFREVLVVVVVFLLLFLRRLVCCGCPWRIELTLLLEGARRPCLVKRSGSCRVKRSFGVVVSGVRLRFFCEWLSCLFSG